MHIIYDEFLLSSSKYTFHALCFNERLRKNKNLVVVAVFSYNFKRSLRAHGV